VVVWQWFGGLDGGLVMVQDGLEVVRGWLSDRIRVAQRWFVGGSKLVQGWLGV